jgi:hypothetical protein
LGELEAFVAGLTPPTRLRLIITNSR